MLAVSCVRSYFNLNDVTLRADGSAELLIPLAVVRVALGDARPPSALKDYEHEAALSACWALRPPGKRSQIE